MGQERVVAIGMQRGRDFLVRLYANWSHLNIAVIGADCESMDGEALPVPAGGWAPQPVTAALDGLAARLTPKVAAGVITLPNRRDLVVSMPPGRNFIRALTLTVTAQGEAIPVAWPIQQASLGQRMPASDDEYKAAFTFRRGRHADPETMMRSAADCVAWRMQETKPVEINGAYTCNAFVILAYKAMELGTAEFDGFIEAHYPAMRQLAGNLDEGLGVRENRYQQTISLQTALWHYRLAKGQVEEFFAVGLEMVSAYRKLADFKFNYSNNLCTSLLFYAVAQYGWGEVYRSNRNLGEVQAIFRRAAALGTKRLNWFGEFEVSYRAAYLALKAATDIKLHQRVSVETLDEINRLCIRVQTPAFLARSLAFLTQMKPRAAA